MKSKLSIIILMLSLSLSVKAQQIVLRRNGLLKPSLPATTQHSRTDITKNSDLMYAYSTLQFHTVR